MKSLKDMDSTTNWMVLLLCIHLREVSKHTKDLESSENLLDGLQYLFVSSHFSMILDRNLEAELQLSYLTQMSMIKIFVLSMNKSQFVKRLANVCSVPVDDVLDGVSGIFLAYFPDFMKEMDWLKKAETEE